MTTQGPPVAPAGRPADGAAILDEVCETLTRYIVFPRPEDADAYTLWIAATHRQDAWEHATRFAFQSPLKRCGKTRALEIGRELVHKALSTSNISVAALVRSIDEADPPALFLDEADAIFGRRRREKEGAEDLRGILNSGHCRGWPYVRWDPVSRRREECATFAMAAIGGIGELPDTIADRAIVINMRRRAPRERIMQFRRRRVIPQLHELGNRLHIWLANLPGLADAEPALPVEDRDADKWEPLVVIADAAGGDWPERARKACAVLSGDTVPDDASIGERLLADLAAVWGDGDTLDTATILENLRAVDEAPWGDYYGHPLNARDLARLLRPYGVRPKNIRFGDRQGKGYVRADLADPWRRYVPAVPTSQESERPGHPWDGSGTEDVLRSVPGTELRKQSLGDAGTDGTGEGVRPADLERAIANVRDAFPGSAIVEPSPEQAAT